MPRSWRGENGAVVVTIVIVEDDPMVGHALQRELRTLRTTSRLVLDAELAEAALVEEHPRLVISDLRMPGRTGVEVLAMARERFPLVRRCLLTGTMSDLRQVHVALIEPCALLRKPWRTDELVQLLASLR